MPSVKPSNAKFLRDVASQIHTTDGVWAPDTSKMTKVSGKDLPTKLKPAFNKLVKENGSADAFTTKVDGKSVYLIQSFNTDVGAAITELKDAGGKDLKMGDAPHKKLPLPHSEEPAVPVSRAMWLADLKDAMRYPVQAADTPIITGSQIPEKVAAIVDKM